MCSHVLADSRVDIGGGYISAAIFRFILSCVSVSKSSATTVGCKPDRCHQKKSILEKPNITIMSIHLLQHTECIETEKRLYHAGSISSIRTWRLNRTLMVKATLINLSRQEHIAETCDRACYRVPRLSLFPQGVTYCMGWTVRKVASTSLHDVYEVRYFSRSQSVLVSPRWESR